MNVTVLYNSSVVRQVVSAQLVKSRFPNATFLNTNGLNTAGIDGLITSITNASQQRVYVLAVVGANPPAGNLTAGQVSTINSTKFSSIAGSDTAARVIAASSGTAPNGTTLQPTLTWNDLYPGQTPPYICSILSRRQFWTWVDGGTATAGAASSITNSAKAYPVDGLANGGLFVEIVSGTGAGQVRKIASNTATAITVTKPWNTAPDNTSAYIVFGYTLSTTRLTANLTATSGTNNTIVRTGSGWTVNAFTGASVRIISGTGANQEALIVSNTATALTVVSNWSVNPDNTSVFEIVSYGYQGVDNVVAEPTQQATAGGANTIANGNLAASLSWPTNLYAGFLVRIVSGTGAGQVRVIASNTGNTITTTNNWAVNPDATSVFTIINPTARPWPYELSNVYLPLAIQTSYTNLANSQITEKYNNIFGTQPESVRLEKNGGQDLRLLESWIAEGKTIWTYLNP